MKIKASKISKTYGERQVVNSVSLEILPGKILGLLGPNGAGKSTIIKMLTGQLQPDSGSIFIDDIEYKELPESARANLGVMPQDIVIWDDLTVMENLKFSANLYNLDAEKTKTRLDFLIEALKLQPEINTLARNLSGGYKRRLNLAISIVHEPKVIFLDEPTPGIDAQSRYLLMDFIQKLADTGDYSIVLTDHYLDEVEKICDYIVIIDHGEIVTEGRLQDLKLKHGNGNLLSVDLNFESPSDKAKSDIVGQKLLAHFVNGQIVKGVFAALTSDISGSLKAAVDLISAEQMPLHNISVKEPSLEDIFLLLTGKDVRE